MKILYLGLGKSWTTSFGTACEILGYKVIENDMSLLEEIKRGDFKRTWKTVKEYDVFEDYPWPYLWKEFDKKFDTKFVYGIRPVNEWIRSLVYQAIRSPKVDVRRDIDKRHTTTFDWKVQGYTKYLPLHRNKLVQWYEERNKELKDYFEGRDDFLVWHIKDGWKPICDFLGKDVPDLPFPHRKNAYPHPNYTTLLNMSETVPQQYFGW